MPFDHGDMRNLNAPTLLEATESNRLFDHIFERNILHHIEEEKKVEILQHWAQHLKAVTGRITRTFTIGDVVAVLGVDQDGTVRHWGSTMMDADWKDGERIVRYLTGRAEL